MTFSSDESRKKNGPPHLSNEKIFFFFHRLLTFYLSVDASKYNGRSFTEGPNILSEYPKSNTLLSTVSICHVVKKW